MHRWQETGIWDLPCSDFTEKRNGLLADYRANSSSCMQQSYIQTHRPAGSQTALPFIRPENCITSEFFVSILHSTDIALLQLCSKISVAFSQMLERKFSHHSVRGPHLKIRLGFGAQSTSPRSEYRCASYHCRCRCSMHCPLHCIAHCSALHCLLHFNVHSSALLIAV